MPNLIAMSFEGDLSPSFDLRRLQHGQALPDGWGIGFYPGTEPSASVVKEPAPPPGSMRAGLIQGWDHVASSVFMLHFRAARWGSISDANTQPFARSWGRREWLFAHSGSLDAHFGVSDGSIFEPIGSTDTEAVFCELLARVAARKWKSLREADPLIFRGWLRDLNELGVLTCVITDGDDVVVYADRRHTQPLYLWEILPPYETVVFGDDDLQVDLTRHGAKSRRGVVVATSMLLSEGPESTSWRELAPGTMAVLRQGALVSELVPSRSGADVSLRPPDKPMPPARPRVAPPRRLEIRHRTEYHYEEPIERSTHVFRLEPVHDRLQRVASHSLNVSVDGKWRDYDDVFGNRARRLLIETPFSDLVIEAHSLVVTLDTHPLDFRPLHARTTIPLNWLPFQRHMLAPYLLPPELPESQLIELHDYAMSFVERNGFDLVDSLLDMNQSIYRDYVYKQGATTILTTPFEVYTLRTGVCQDFTNLFMCMVRLLGIPARYVCGYLYTGPKHENRAMAEATHAWAQVYLPELGWKGFDPTNGVMCQTDHVRVSVGRNYLDATPTSGTIFAGGGAETLKVAVTVEEDA